ncbi:MAG: hypothetical protein F6K24_04235 [Okeania sp. SIO2D1]|nr:hypothetical protein [Okeania sp. SIO2D1]
MVISQESEVRSSRGEWPFARTGVRREERRNKQEKRMLRIISAIELRSADAIAHTLQKMSL